MMLNFKHQNDLANYYYFFFFLTGFNVLVLETKSLDVENDSKDLDLNAFEYWVFPPNYEKKNTF